MNSKSKALQGGSILVEALMAILIFSFGILGIIGLQTSMIVNAAEAKYRSEAGFFVNRLLGQMATADRLTPTAMAVFASPSGTSYTTWYNAIKNTNSADGLLGLPGAATNPPIVTITPVFNSLNPAFPVSYDVTATVFWQTPGQKGVPSPVHQHVVKASVPAD